MRLPQGWADATVDDLGEYLNGMAFKPTDWGDEGIGIIRIQNLTAPSKSLNRTKRPFEERYRVRKGDLLVSWSATLDAFIWEREDAVLNQHIFKVTPSECVDPRFLFFQLRELIAEMAASEHLHGSTMKHINRGPFLAHSAALPPLAEQRRIVVKLDALTARLARARAELDRVPVLAAQLRARTLAEAFDGKFIRGLVSHRPCDEWIVSTFYGPRFGKDEYVDDGIPTARTTDFNSDGTMCLEGAPQVACSDADFTKWGLEEGDLLVTRTGSIGKCAIYTPDLGRVLPSAYLIRVRFTSTILTRFAWMMFASPQGQQHLGVNSRAVTQPNINASAIRSLSFPAMDVAAQQATIDAVDRAFAHADRLEAEATRARALLDRLESALLAKAFRGELVPQDPNDEPAQVLLDRIRTQRANAPKAKQGRKAKVAGIGGQDAISCKTEL